MQRGFKSWQDGFPCAGAEFSALSTKLSTGCVDKSENRSVYRDLGNKPRVQVRYLLHCMIACHDTWPRAVTVAPFNAAGKNRARSRTFVACVKQKNDYKKFTVSFSYAQSKFDQADNHCGKVQFASA